jgi:hypothetical protein
VLCLQEYFFNLITNNSQTLLIVRIQQTLAALNTTRAVSACQPYECCICCIACAICVSCKPTCRRLLAALWDAQRNLKFWRSRLSAGSHGSFMLLERGPVGFVTGKTCCLTDT